MEVTWNDIRNIENVNLIDIRPCTYDNILKSKKITFQNLISNPNKYLNKSDTYYIFCSYGQTSKTCSHYLNSLGYKTFSIKGGVESYDE